MKAERIVNFHKISIKFDCMLISDTKFLVAVILPTLNGQQLQNYEYRFEFIALITQITNAPLKSGFPSLI